MSEAATIRPVVSKADRKAFVHLPFRLYTDDPAWIPPLKDEAMGLITPGKNPFFEHAKAQLFLADRGGEVVGRISASIDHAWTPMPADKGPTGFAAPHGPRPLQSLPSTYGRPASQCRAAIPFGLCPNLTKARKSDA